MFNNNNNQIIQQSCSVPMANAMGNSNGFDLLKISSTLPSPSAATFFAQPPPSSNVVKLFSNTISSPPPPPCSASTAAAIFGQKSAARSPTRGMSPKRAGSKSPNRSSNNQAQRRSGSAQRVKSNSSHRRRAVHGHCGGGVAEPPSMCSSSSSSATTTTTIRYNYAQRKDCSEKTPMCRLAELARANHLKHEYVLLDESGPAHCKNFTVKLVLCPGQEFEGTGASIKKAQQSAAQAAIDRCQLAQRPPAVPAMLLRGSGGGAIFGGARRPSGIRRDDQKSPICLLNSVAAQLGISLHYREECLINNVPKSLQKPSPTNLPPSFLACFLPQALYPAAMHCLNGSSAPPPPIFAHPPPQQQHRQLAPTALAPFTSRLPPPFGSSSLKCMPPAAMLAASAPQKAPNGGAGLLPSAFMMPPPPPPFPSVAVSNSLSATMCHHPCFAQQMHHHHHHPFLPFPSLPPPSATNGCANAFAPQHPNAQSHAVYKVIVRLSKDGTEHVGLGPSLTMAKQKAATLALAHLRPELEGLKRQREGNQHLQEQTGDEAEERVKLMPKTASAKEQQHGVPGLETAVPIASSPVCEDNERRELDVLNTLDALDGQECQEERMGEDLEADCCTTDDQNVVNVGTIAADQQVDGTSSSKSQQKVHKKYKSVVSQIHECALQLRMNVEFEMVAEFGEPHNRTYSVCVRLISPSSATSLSSTTMTMSSSSAEHSNNSGQNQREFVANGQGLSKKAAKQAACQKLLDQVKHLLELDPIQLASSVVRPTSGAVRRANSLGEAAAQKTEIHSTKRKTIIKDKKMDPNYGSGVNPVSRLIQVMQVRGARDPVFQVIGEHGQNRHKEFTVSVQCMDEGLETGTGPNKKLAKRAAAEAMLAKIGYVKPMPQPGKSLLKKSAFTENINNNNMNNVNNNDASASPVKGPMPIIDVFVVPELDEDGWAKCPEVAAGQNLELAQMPTGMETFADVEQCFGDEQQPKKKQYIERMQSPISVPDDHRLKWVNPPLDMEEDGCAADDCGGDDADVDGQHRPAALCSADNSGSSPSELGSPLPDDDDDMHSTRRRRVTFSDTVRACPPPGATEAASIAPLKSELCTRPKRRLRPFSKDSQRMLSEEETKRLAAAAALFLAWPSVEADKCGLTLINASTTDGGTAVDEDDGELLAIALQTLNTGKQQPLLDDSNTTTRTTQLNSLSPTPTNSNNMNLRPNSLNMAPANSLNHPMSTNIITPGNHLGLVPTASLNLTIMNMASANNMNMMAANCLPTNNMNLTSSSNRLNMSGANSLNMTTTSNIMSRMLANNLNGLSVNGLNMSQSPMVPPSLPMFPVPPPPPPPTIMPAAPSSAASGLTFSMPNIQHKFTVMEAKQFLEKLACTYHFTVVYSDFPKTRNDANEEQCFSLVTLGFAKPIVCHGSGHTKHVAHNDAALNAVRKCCGQQMATAPENAGSSNK